MPTFDQIVSENETRREKEQVVAPVEKNSAAFESIVSGKPRGEERIFDPQGAEIVADDGPNIWGRLGQMFSDPDKAGAEAVQAITDSALLNNRRKPGDPFVTPSEALRYKKYIDRDEKVNPARFKLRGDLKTIVKQNLNIGFAQVNLGGWGYEALIGNTNEQVEAGIKQTQAAITPEEERPLPETIPQEFAGSAAEMFPFLVESAKAGGWRGLMLGGGTWLLGAATGSSAITYPLIPAMYAVGQTSGSLEFVGKVEAGLAYVEMRDFEDPETGEKINENVARAAAFGVGTINGLLEFAQLKTLINTFPGGKKVLRGLINDTIKETVQTGALTDILGRAVTQFGLTVVKETTQELAQESTNITADVLSRKVTNYLDGTDLSGPEKQDIIKRLTETAKQSAQAFTVLALPGPTISAGLSIKEVRAREAEAKGRQERAQKVFKATAFQELRKAEPVEPGAAPRPEIDITPEELQRFVETPELSTIKEEQLDAIINQVTEDETDLTPEGKLLIDRLVQEAGLDVAPEGEPPAQIGDDPVSIDTPEFKTFFGESKVVDDKGNPEVVFHGTKESFEAFDPERSIGGTFWFTNKKALIEEGEVGAQGEGVILDVFLSLQNPAGWKEYDKFGIDELISRGFDGLKLVDDDQTTYVAFHPEQIKSATENIGAFDPTDPDIRASIGESEKLNNGVNPILSDEKEIGSINLEITDDYIRIADIELRPPFRDKGAGTETINKVIAQAAQSGIPVVLSSDAMRGKDAQKRQRQLYKRLGFKKNKSFISGGVKEEFILRPGEATAAIGEAEEPLLREFTPEEIEHVGLKEATESGIISTDEAAAIDGILQNFPEAYRAHFVPRFSKQKFAPTEAQLKAHGIKAETVDQIVKGVLLSEDVQGLKDETRSVAVMFAGSDITTFLHEFGEFAHKRLLTPAEKKYVAGIARKKAPGKSPNEFFSDEFRNFMVREVEQKDSLYPPKLTELFRKVADSIREIWERIRNLQPTPALDELFFQIITGQKEVEEVSRPGATAVRPRVQAVRATGARTLGGAIRAMGGIDFLNFKGELKEMAVSVKRLSKKSGVPIDVAEANLRAEGWLGPDETLLDILREDPDVLRRARIADISEFAEKAERELTDTERELIADADVEAEQPPDGEYVRINAEDIPEGDTLIIIEGKSGKGWGEYTVSEKDPFGITIKDVLSGEEIALTPLEKVSLKTDRISATHSDIIDLGAKTRINQIAGITKTTQQRRIRDLLRIEELGGAEAIKTALKVAAQDARAALREGKTEALATEKARMRALIDKAKRRISLRSDAKKIRAQTIKELKTSRAKKVAGKPKGKFGPERQVILDRLRELTGLTQAQASTELVGRLDKYETTIPTIEEALENRILAMLSQPLIEATERDLIFWNDTLEIIQALKQTGRAEVQQRIAEIAEERADQREQVIDIVGGLSEEAVATGRRVVDTDLGRKQRLRNAFFAGGFQLGAIQDWDNLLDILSFGDITTKPGDSEISKIGNVFDAQQEEKEGGMLTMEASQQIYMDAYGIENESQLVTKYEEDAIEHDLGTYLTLTGKTVDLKMTRAQARKRWMEFSDASLHDPFFAGEDTGGKMGITTEMVAAIDGFLTDQDKDYAQRQIAFYQEYYNTVNEVYKAMYGLNLPFNNFYSPISREGVSKEEDAIFGEMLQDAPFRGSAATAGSLKSRVRNMNTIKLQSDTNVLTRHVMEMEHFKAWAERIRDLNAIFGNEEVTRAIRENFGSNMVKEINSHIQDFARGRIDQSENYNLLDQWRVNYTQSVLAVKPSLFVKQLTSVIAFADSIPVKDWGRDFAGALKSPKRAKEVINELYDNSAFLKERWKKGSIERDILAARQTEEFNKMTIKPSFKNRLMFLIRLGDMGAIIFGGYPVYKYHLDKNKAAGMSDADAQAEAIRTFEMQAQSSQQSSDLSKLSRFQKGSSLYKLFTMFKTTPLQYLRKEISALRNLAAGRISKKEFAKTMLIYHFMLPMIFQWVSDLFPWGSDDDEDEGVLGLPINRSTARVMILGNLNGIFIFGDMLDWLISESLGLFAGDATGIPPAQIIKDIKRAIDEIDPDEMTDEDFLQAIRALAGAAGGASGLPLKQVVDFGTGFSDTLSGKYEKGVAEMMGWSPHVAGKRFEEE